jgi:hypothetical protein
MIPLGRIPVFGSTYQNAFYASYSYNFGRAFSLTAGLWDQWVDTDSLEGVNEFLEQI